VDGSITIVAISAAVSGSAGAVATVAAIAAVRRAQAGGSAAIATVAAVARRRRTAFHDGSDVSTLRRARGRIASDDTRTIGLTRRSRRISGASGRVATSCRSAGSTVAAGCSAARARARRGGTAGRRTTVGRARRVPAVSADPVASGAVSAGACPAIRGRGSGVGIPASTTGSANPAIARICSSAGGRATQTAGSRRVGVTATGRNRRGGGIPAIAAGCIARNAGSGFAAVTSGSAGAAVAGSARGRSAGTARGCSARTKATGAVTAVARAISTTLGVATGRLATEGIAASAIPAGRAAAIRNTAIGSPALRVAAGIAANRDGRRGVTARGRAVGSVSTMICIVIGCTAMRVAGISTVAALRGGQSGGGPTIAAIAAVST
jgi:hypothetical protein